MSEEINFLTLLRNLKKYFSALEKLEQAQRNNYLKI